MPGGVCVAGWDDRIGPCQAILDILESEAKGKNVHPFIHLAKCPPIFWTKRKKWINADQSENLIYL